MGRLHGKIALITGTADGQGRAAALLFAKEGAKVAGCDLDARGAEETRRMVVAAGGEMFSKAPVDLGCYHDAAAWVDEAAEHFGGVDVLYNNAGGAKIGPFMSGTIDDYRFTMRNSLDVVVFPTRAAWPHLIARGGGSIINTGTILSHRVTTVPLSMNGSAKGAVASLAPHLAAEGGPDGIRVNTLSPGLIETAPTRAFIGDPTSSLQRQVRTSPLGRVGQPEDVASVALFLASDDSRYVTGIEIIVDGGQTIGIGLQFGEEPDVPRRDVNSELKGKVAPTRTVEVQTRDGVADCYVFTPADSGPASWPGVLMYSDIMGVRPVFMSMAQRIADGGFTVLMPNLFYRSGPPLDPPLSARNDQELPTLLNRAAPLTRDAIASDAQAYVEALRALPTTLGSKIGCVGYCMSGQMAIWTAGALGDHVAAVAAFHGAGLATREVDSPAAIAAGTDAKYYFGLAEIDPFMTPDAISLLQKTLGDADIEFRAEVFPDTFHGFTVLDAAFDRNAAEIHYERIDELMRSTLVETTEPPPGRSNPRPVQQEKSSDDGSAQVQAEGRRHPGHNPNSSSGSRQQWRRDLRD